jgi:AraC family transcriptional regulator
MALEVSNFQSKARKSGIAHILMSAHQFVFSTFKISERRYAAGQTQPLHKDERMRISIVLNGRVKETCGKQEEWGGPFSAVIKPTDALHRNVFGPESVDILSIEPGNDFLSTCSPGLTLHNWQWRHDTALIRPVVQLLKSVRASQAREELILENILNVLSFFPVNRREDAGKNCPDWIARLKERMQDEYRENLSVQRLAAELGLHPVYLARVFRKYCGCSPKDYLFSLRLKNASAALTADNTALAHLAYDFGFADQSHLSRQLKAATGCSPGIFREKYRVA